MILKHRDPNYPGQAQSATRLIHFRADNARILAIEAETKSYVRLYPCLFCPFTDRSLRLLIDHFQATHGRVL